MKFKKMLLFLLIATILFCFAAPSFAYEFENENAPTAKELTEFADEADWFLNLVFDGELRGYYSSSEVLQKWWNDPSNKKTNWAREHGYLPDVKILKNIPKDADNLFLVNTYTGKRMPVPDGYGYVGTVYAFNENVTFDKIQKDLMSFFAYDSVFENPCRWGNEDFIEDTSGKLYTVKPGREDDFPGIDWDKGEITVQRKNWIEVTVPDFDREYFTVEYTKTKDGWRISGGSYFKMYYDFGDFTPPETGDSTASYFALATLSFLALPFAAVALGRKRKTL